ncbi:MAG: thioredoxin domain-containing protein [Psychrobacter sp.]|nr:thioredoxin domain-containing protein [Psychrobacter sp.]
MSLMKTGVLYVAIPFLSVMVGYQALQTNRDLEQVSIVSDTLTPTPQVLKDLESLGGFKEDESIDAKKTLYIFYDPTCPSCHTLFDASKKNLYQKQGITIKWIPTTILGDEEESVSAAIYGLTANSKEQQAKIFSANKPYVPITSTGVEGVSTNNQYLKTYSSLTASILAVPTVLYMSPNGSNVTISYNISDDAYLLELIDGIS